MHLAVRMHHSGVIRLLTTRRASGPNRRTIGNARSQEVSHDLAQAAANPGPRPAVTAVETHETIRDMRPESTRPNSAGSNFLGILLVCGASVAVAGPAGTRRIPIDDVFVRSGITTLGPGELVTAIELPRPASPRGSVSLRRTRRRGHDLASVTLACAISGDGVMRMAYGSLGPRPILVTDTSGLLADPAATEDARRRRLAELFVDASPSARSMRASPEYRLVMLQVLGLRGIAIALERLAAAEPQA